MNKEQKYQELLDKYQEEARRIRSKTYSPLIVLGIVLAIAFLSVFISFGNGSFGSGMFMMMVGAVGLIIFGLILNSNTKKYKAFFKEKIVSEIFQFHFDDFHYDYDNGFTKEEIRDTEMVSMGSIFESNDYIEGTHNNVRFRQADVLVQDVRSTGKSTHTVTLFKGRWLVYDFNKSFKGYLQLRDRENQLFGKNAKPYSFFSNLPKMNHITFENQDFNDTFSAYATDAQEAFYLVTPHFMEKLMELDRKIDCPVIFGFINNELHVACYNNDDAFEIGFDTLSMSTFKELDEDVTMIKDVIDILDLER